MTDPRALLNAYGAEYLDPEGECIHDCDDNRRDAAAATFVALHAVLDLRPPEMHEDDDPELHATLTEGWTTCRDAVRSVIAQALEER